MNASTRTRWDGVLVRTARYLVATYLLFFVLDRIKVMPGLTEGLTQTLFWATVLIGITAIPVRYRTHVQSAAQQGQQWLKRATNPQYERTLTLATRNVTIAFFLTVTVVYLRPAIRFHLAVGMLYDLLIVMFSLTLLVRKDRAAMLATKVGALAIVVGLTLGQFVDLVRGSLGVDGYVLTGVLVTLTIWKERDRLIAWEREGRRMDDRRYVIAVSLMTLAAVGVYGYRLGYQQFNGDEHQVVAAAAGFYHTGTFHMWNWVTAEPRPVVYDRAWPHTLLVAVSYAVFGISEWSSRFPSAVAGVLTVPVSYVVFRYFTERKLVAFATSATLLFHPMYVDFFRWTRMYAILIPLFLVLVYLSFRTLTEENTVDFRNDRVNRLVETYLDFNIRIGMLTILVFYLSYQVHLNALFVLPVGYLFVIYQAILTRERKYLVATVLGTAGLLVTVTVVLFTDRLAYLSNFISLFARRNTIYVEYVFQIPFEEGLGVVLFCVGLVSFSKIGNGRLRSKTVYLYILTSFALVFLIFVGNRYAGFAYVIHVVPIGLLLVIRAFRMFTSAFRPSPVRYGLAGLLLLGMVLPLIVGAYGHDYRTQYVEDDNDFTTAYGTIISNYEDRQAVFAQYPRRYYLRGLDPDAKIVSMEHSQEYAPEEFHRDLRRSESGWVTWESEKTYHIHPEIRTFVREHFLKYHGTGVDDTGVEVYYFNESMLGSILVPGKGDAGK